MTFVILMIVGLIAFIAWAHMTEKGTEELLKEDVKR